ncbi:TPA: hypothetical protein ACGH17_004555 [Salmonella enterica subsp. enterica serovar Anatum]|nr:hypothetical protein [Salmonella enterica]EBJ9131248.1 hypothetical protein [Salmonella enterica]
MINEAYRKALAEKHIHQKQAPHIEARLHKQAVDLIKHIQSGINKELDKLETELEKSYSYSNKPEYKEHVERNYIHTRAVLMGIHESLSKEIKSWNAVHTHHYK